MECSLAFNQGSYVGTGCPEEQSQFESGESAVRLCTVCGGKTPDKAVVGDPLKST